MLLGLPLQPDQDAVRWDAHVAGYEQVFEPLTNAFARTALRLLGPLSGMSLLDAGAGAGGAALQAARLGARVTAVDASVGMVRRIAERAAAAGASVTAAVQDGMALDVLDSSFDRALSCLGVVLFPDPARGMAELYRVLRPGGRAAIVTWTQPHRYELAARLGTAIAAVRGAAPTGPLPAQLRFIDPDRLRALVSEAGFIDIRIETIEAALRAPSARQLAASLAFAPGMAATLDALGPDREPVLRAFVARLEADGAADPVSLGAVAHVAIGERSTTTRNPP